MRCLVIVAALVAAMCVFERDAAAHCDAMDGPVVAAARAALQKNQVSLVLSWVAEKDEAEVRRAFDHTLAVRGLGAAARDLADRYLYETVVRLHRAGEGMPYTGLKPAGITRGSAVPAADRALETKDPDRLLRLLTAEVEHAVRRAFAEVLQRRSAMAPDDVRAGRAFVEAYTRFIHVVETLYEAAHAAPHHGESTK